MLGIITTIITDMGVGETATVTWATGIRAMDMETATVMVTIAAQTMVADTVAADTVAADIDNSFSKESSRHSS
jgi:hypothetical protein